MKKILVASFIVAVIIGMANPGLGLVVAFNITASAALAYVLG